MKKKPVYTTSAKEAFAIELRRMQTRLNELRDKMNEAIGDGTLPDNIEWADVGSVRTINQALSDALIIQI